MLAVGLHVAHAVTVGGAHREVLGAARRSAVLRGAARPTDLLRLAHRAVPAHHHVSVARREEERAALLRERVRREVLVDTGRAPILCPLSVGRSRLVARAQLARRRLGEAASP